MSTVQLGTLQGLLRSDPLCSTFMKMAEKIWNDLKIARGYGICRQEETVTEVFLLDVQAAHPWEVATFQFHKAHEAITGADWEWWLTDGKKWLGLLIQAKILNPKSNKYTSIKHKVKGKPQIDIIIEQANRKNINALYFFYNHTKLNFPDIKWHCRSLPPKIEQIGCSVAHATAVKSMVKQGGLGVAALSHSCVPLRCLVCCRGYSVPNDTLPGRASGLVNSLPRGDGVRRDIPSLRTSPPDYVSDLLSAPPDGRQAVIDKLRSRVGPIGSLVVIKDRS